MPGHRYELVVVSYHSRDQVLRLLDAVAVPGSRAVVVDNASGADGLHEALEALPGVRWLDGHDSGFARAANLGARSSSAEFVVFLNPDTRPTPALLQALLSELVDDPELVLCAATPVDAAGRVEIGVAGWEPTVGRCLVHAAGLHRLLPTHGVYARPAPGQPIDPDWITGACVAARRETLLRLGGFDERYYVYNEDMALGATVRAAGLRQMLRTDLLVPHAAGSSGGGSTRMAEQRGVSMAAYLEDHNGPVAARAMRLVLLAGTLVRAALALLRGRTPVRRAHTAYCRGLITRRSPFSAT